jgi:hypothetical protein
VGDKTHTRLERSSIAKEQKKTQIQTRRNGGKTGYKHTGRKWVGKKISEAAKVF